jgi:hypothetical protein
MRDISSPNNKKSACPKRAKQERTLEKSTILGGTSSFFKVWKELCLDVRLSRYPHPSSQA